MADHLYGLQEMFMAKLGLKGSSKVSALTVAGIISIATALAVAVGYAVHRVRMRGVMQNEIRDIMCAPGCATWHMSCLQEPLMCELPETEKCGFQDDLVANFPPT